MSTELRFRCKINIKRDGGWGCGMVRAEPT